MAAQVTARSMPTHRSGALDYINIGNDGRSQLRLFRIRTIPPAHPTGVGLTPPPVVSNPVMAAVAARTAPRSVTIDWKAPVSDNPSTLPVTFSYELKAVEAVRDMNVSPSEPAAAMEASRPSRGQELGALSATCPRGRFAKAEKAGIIMAGHGMSSTYSEARTVRIYYSLAVAPHPWRFTVGKRWHPHRRTGRQRPLH